jgi:hypothetical protein
MVVRAAEAWEYMRLQGWGDRCWNVERMADPDPLEEEGLELIESMAGNA